MLLIGSHVSMSGKDMFLQSVKDSISNGANSMMIYTGAPQNTRRRPISELNLGAGQDLMKEYDLKMENVIIHAPYIINLANTVKEETFAIAISFLKEEIVRTQAIGAKYIVLHPGAHVKAGVDVGIAQIINGLNQVLTKEQDVIVCLETMAGKGTELGINFEQLATIINGVNYPEKLGVCLDTCHIHDAGFDIEDFNKILDEFDKIIGLDKLHVIHLNDSKNIKGASKDRHENIGYGHIGFENLINIIYNERIENIVKILETPYVNGRTIAPYKKEIKMIKDKKFEDWLDKEGNIKNVEK